jgi:hypothetical protein
MCDSLVDQRCTNKVNTNLPSARTKAWKWLDLIEQGTDPAEVFRQAQLAQQRKDQTTFAVIAEDWLASVVRGKQRQARAVEADVQREFIPRWGGKPIADIAALDVRNAIRDVNKRAPAQARNVLGAARRLFAWAVAQHAYGLERSPAEQLRPRASWTRRWCASGC